MATKTFYATRGFRYGTRMLTAGDPVDMDAPTARLYTALGKITPDKPKAARTAVAPAVAPAAEAPAKAPRKRRKK